jgi:hypothetical protein
MPIARGLATQIVSWEDERGERERSLWSSRRDLDEYQGFPVVHCDRQQSDYIHEGPVYLRLGVII